MAFWDPGRNPQAQLCGKCIERAGELGGDFRMQNHLSRGILNKTGGWKHIVTSNNAWVLPISSQDPMAHK